MADTTIDYPDGLGYARWQASRDYPAGARVVMEGAFTSRTILRTRRKRRWSGEFETPIRDRLRLSDKVALDRFVQKLEAGHFIARIPFARLDLQTGVTRVHSYPSGTHITIRPTSVRRGYMDEDGNPRGATIQWIEHVT